MNFSPSKTNGFTLLETILAVALSAVLMGLIAAGLRAYTNVVANRSADVVHAQLARAVLQRIAGDLRATVYEEEQEDSSLSAEGAIPGDLGALPEAGDDLGGEGDTSANDFGGGDSLGSSTGATDLTNSSVAPIQGLYGNVSELRLDVRGPFPHPMRYDALVQAGGDPLVDNLVSVDRVVTYYLRSMDPSELVGTPLESPNPDQTQPTAILVRRIQKRAEAELESTLGGNTMATSGEQLLSDQVSSLEFLYHDGYDWTDSWDSEEMGGLPIAVQITLAVGEQVEAESAAVSSAQSLFQLKVALPTAVIAEDSMASEEF